MSAEELEALWADITGGRRFTDNELTFARTVWNVAMEVAARESMNAPLIESCGEFPYMTDSCKAMALSVSGRIISLKAAPQGEGK